MITYESCFTGKVSTHSCEHIMKEYVHGLFTTDVENRTSKCTQLYFVESIRKNFVLTGGTGSYCNGGLHSLFTSCSAWFKICFLDFIMIKKCCGNELFYKSWWILRIKFLDCQTNKTVNIWNIWKLFVVMATTHSMDQDTRANHSKAQEVQALRNFVCIWILQENVWEQTK